MNWLLDENLHVMPINDLRPHDSHPQCWCNPKPDDECPDVILHNSMDGREAFEIGERLPS